MKKIIIFILFISSLAGYSQEVEQEVEESWPKDARKCTDDQVRIALNFAKGNAEFPTPEYKKYGNYECTSIFGEHDYFSAAFIIKEIGMYCEVIVDESRNLKSWRGCSNMDFYEVMMLIHQID